MRKIRTKYRSLESDFSVIEEVNAILTIPQPQTNRCDGVVGVAADFDGCSLMFSSLNGHCQSRMVDFNALNDEPYALQQVWREHSLNAAEVVFDRSVVGLPPQKAQLVGLVEGELRKGAENDEFGLTVIDTTESQDPEAIQVDGTLAAGYAMGLAMVVAIRGRE